MGNQLPIHLGYIVDGNRRWAKARGKSSLEGHKAGQKALLEIVEATFDRGVKFVSAYIFSTENWNRTADEVDYLMKIFETFFSKEVKNLHKKNIRVLFFGNRTQKISPELVKLIEEGEDLTRENSAGTLCLCFNYGGQLEIAEAVTRIAGKVKAGELELEDISVETFSENIYHPEVPTLDLIVRTSGEQRISGFHLWRAAYSELMFLDKAWPEMKKEDVDIILNDYAKRDRRMGGDSKK